MAEMSMNKVIHGAFRRDLDRFQTALAAFRDGDRERAAQLARAWENFDKQVTGHHHSEHEIVWPAIAKVGVSRDLLIQLDSEHDRLGAALTAARTAFATLRNSATKADVDAAHAAVAELKTVALEHFEHEEAELEPVFAAKKHDPVIKEMGRELGKEGSLAEGGRFLAWVSDGASPRELAVINDEIPKPVRVIIGGIFGRSYRHDVGSVWKT